MQLLPVDRSPQWRPQGADLYSTGASGAVPVRPINPTNPVESMDRLGQGAIVREPDKPSNEDTANRDWTLPKTENNEVKKEEPEPPKDPPLYKLMIDFIQSVWRASTMAVDAADNIVKAGIDERVQQEMRDEPLVYAEPKVKRQGSVEA